MASRESSTDSSLFYWLALERAPRVGPLTMARLYDAFGDPRAALEARAQDIRKRTGLSEKIADTIAAYTIPTDRILKDMERLNDIGARVVTRWDAEYPPNLEEIYDPPALLFVRGTFQPEDSRAVAVVGTRHPTSYGLEMTRSITRDLVQAGITVVSGLARGIDTACHKEALKQNGRTLGVLGCGIDVTYPRENGSLKEEMAEKGAVISEFRPGVPPMATNFYRRNRIVSGLAKGIVVVESAASGGSLITANHAVDQNRDVFAVPGSVMNKRSAGTHQLIKQGAGLVESAADILSALFFAGNAQVPRQAALFQRQPRSVEISNAAQTALDALEIDPVPIDFLCDTLKIDAGTLSGILLELELNGLVRQHPGKMFSRISEPREEGV